jgi:UPF0755 protein
MKKIILIITIVILLALYLWQIFIPVDSNSNEQISISVEKGQTTRDIALNLQEKGLIKLGPIFRLYVLLNGSAKKLQAGVYQFSKSMNLVQIAGKLATGETMKEKLTIIEGWNLRNIGSYLESKELFQSSDFWLVSGLPATDYSKEADLPKPFDFSDKYEFLESKPENVGLEGFLFPDTYEISKELKVEDIIKKMLDNFNQKFTIQLKEEISRQNKTIFEIITMASILEKEVQGKEDKEIVSGIFWKRIKLQKQLESCATIAYIKGVDQWQYSFQDSRIDSPFNTYINYGLPLGPISNPGMESILAAIYPQSSEYLYFLSTPEGQTIYSKTYQEHLQAKAEYLD